MTIIGFNANGTRKYAWLPMLTRRALLRRAPVIRVRATQGGSRGPACFQRCHFTTHVPMIHCSTILCQQISDFSHPRPSTHVVMLLGPMEHARHASSNPRRNNALAVGSASELLWRHAIIGLRRTLDLSHIFLTHTTRLMRTPRTPL